MIDIGGPAMLRAAAKNFVHVVPVCRPSATRRSSGAAARRGSSPRRPGGSWPPRRSPTPPPTRLDRLAGSRDRETFPPRLSSRSRRSARPPLRREPAPAGAYYAEAGSRRHLLSRVEQLCGPRALLQQPRRPRRGARGARASSRSRPASIVKHANPCGAPSRPTIEEACEKALQPIRSPPTAASSRSTAGRSPRSPRGSRSSSSRC